MLRCLYNDRNNYNLQVIDQGQKYICEPSATHIHELINAGYNYIICTCVHNIYYYNVQYKQKGEKRQ